MFLFINFFSLNISDFSLYFVNIATPLKKVAPIFQQPPQKLTCRRRFNTPSPTPSWKGRGAHYGNCSCTPAFKCQNYTIDWPSKQKLFHHYNHAKIAQSICSVYSAVSSNFFWGGAKFSGNQGVWGGAVSPPQWGPGAKPRECLAILHSE